MVLVINKPAGLAVQGSSGLNRHVDKMLEAYRDRKGQKPRLVHRLDRDTSGVLVIAKNAIAASFLTKAFRDRTTKKSTGLWCGVPRPPQERLSNWLVKSEDEHGDQKMTVVIREKARGGPRCHALFCDGMGGAKPRLGEPASRDRTDAPIACSYGLSWAPHHWRQKIFLHR